MRVHLVCIITGILLANCANSAPREISLEQIAEEKTLDSLKEKQNTLLEESNTNQAVQGQRQKRWFDYYGFHPINPSVHRGDYGPNVGYVPEDPFVQIHRRLQEINGFVRHPIPPPLPPALPQFPPFFPIFYIPQVGCACKPNKPPQGPARPSNNNQTTENPDVLNRWPDMEDERQNWGIVVNNTTLENEDNDGARPISFDPIPPIRPGNMNKPPAPEENDSNLDDNDGARPISFDPILPIGTISRPAPPVEHGSSQGDVNSILTTTTTVPPSRGNSNRLQPPSTCDSAVLRCCQMPEITYYCFQQQGCPDTSAYGNPCDPGVILRVIERFQIYYDQRNR